MRAVSRKLIESLASSDVSDFADEIEQKVSNLVGLAVEDLSHFLPFVSAKNCILQPANETFSSAITPESEYAYLIGFESPQIELNCLQYNDFWKKFKERFVSAWNASKKQRRRNRKKQKNQVENVAYENVDADKYNLDSLKADLQKAFAKNLSQTSIIYNLDNVIRIVGRDDFGPKVQIYLYPCIKDGDDFKFFISRKKGFYSISFTQRYQNLNDKINDVGENFVKILKVFNSLYRSMSSSNIVPNQLFLESLLFNTPNELFLGEDIYEVFIKIVNYLNLTDVSAFKSIISPDLTIASDKATKSNQVMFLRFLNSLKGM